MAEIHISAWSRSPAGGGGPSIPATLSARITRENIFGDRSEIKVPVLWISLARDRIRIWPADPDRLEALGRDILKAAEQLRKHDEVRG